MNALDLYPDRRIPEDQISVCVDYHIRSVLRPAFISPDQTERQVPLRGMAKYEAYSEMVGEDVDVILGVVSGELEPTENILNDMGITLREIARECWVLCPVVNKITPATVLPVGAQKAMINSLFYVEKELIG